MSRNVGLSDSRFIIYAEELPVARRAGRNCRPTIRRSTL